MPARRRRIGRRPRRRTRAARGGRRRRPRRNVATLVRKIISNQTKEPHTLQYHNAAKFTSAIGTKSWSSGTVFLDRQHMWDMYTKAITGGSTPTTRQMIADKFVLDRASLEMNITNADPHQCYLSMYYCRPRRDIPNLAGMSNILGMLQEGWKNAGIGRAESGTTEAYDKSLTLTPFMSSTFCRYYQIYKVKKILLRPGETFLARISRSRSSVVPGASLFPLADVVGSYDSVNDIPNVFFKNFTKFILFSHHGQSVHAASDANIVSTADCKLDVIATLKFDFHRLPSRPQKTYEVSGVLGDVADDQAVSVTTGAIAS